MAHLVEKMMYVGETPWHFLGTKVEGFVSSAEAIQHAGLDWQVSTQPVFTANGAQVKNWQAVVRSSDNFPLGMVGMRYKPIQNIQGFETLDALAQNGDIQYHTAGSLDHGRKVWILAKLPGALSVAGDEITKYVLFSNSHDGSSALRMALTPVRVVCMNTLNMALQGLTKAEGLSIRHVANAQEKLSQAHQALGIAQDYYKTFQATADQLALAKYTDKHMAELASRLFPAKEDGTVPTRTQNIRDSIVNLFDNGKGHESIRGSAWAAYNGVAEYVDHERGTRTRAGSSAGDKRLQSIWFGSGAALKNHALEIGRAHV